MEKQKLKVKPNIGEEVFEAVTDMIGCHNAYRLSPKLHRELEQRIVEIMKANDWVLKQEACSDCEIVLMAERHNLNLKGLNCRSESR